MNKMRDFVTNNSQSSPSPVPVSPTPWDYVSDVGRGFAGGLMDAGNEIASLKDIFDDEPSKRYLPEVETKTAVGEVVNTITQLGVGLVGAGKFIKVAKGVAGMTGIVKGAKAVRSASKATAVGESMLTGAIADFTVFGENEERLSDIVQQYPSLENPIAEFLASDPTDSKAEARFKNVVEGAILGGAADGLSVFFGAKLMKHLKSGDIKGAEETLEQAPELIEAAQKEAAEKKAKTLNRAEGSASPDITADELKEFAKNTPDEALYSYDAFIKSSVPDKYKQAVSGIVDDVVANMEDMLTSPEPDVLKAFERALPSNKQMAAFLDGVGDEKMLTLVADAVRDKVAPKLKMDVKELHQQVRAMADNGLFNSNETKAMLSLEYDKDVITTIVPRLLGYRMQSTLLAQKFYRMANKRLNGEVVDNFEEFANRAVAYIGNTQEVVSGIGRALGSLNKSSDKETLAKMIDAETAVKKPIETATKATKNPIEDGKDYLGIGASDELEVIGEKQVKALADLKNRGFDVNDADHLKAAHAMLNGDSDKLLNVFANANRKEYAKKSMWKLFINSLLSSPATQIFNVTSNALKLTLSPATRILGGVMTGDFDTITKGVSQYAAYASVAQDSFKAIGAAYRRGGGVIAHDEGMQLITKQRIADDFHAQYVRSKKSGDVTMDDLQNIPPHIATLSNVVGYLGATVQTPLRVMGAMDEFFKQMSYRSEIYSKAMAEATQGGVKDKAAYAADRVTKAFTNGLATDESAIQKALETTWAQSLNNESLVGNAAINIGNIRALKPFVPFIKTPSNLILDIIAHSPLAPLTREFRQAKAAGGEAWAEVQGKVAVGQVLCFGGVMLAAEDKITGGYPKDPEAKAVWQAMGRLPYSFKVGDKYIPFSRLDPFGAFFGIAADLHDISTRSDTGGGDVASTLITAVIKNMTNKTYVAGLADALDVLSDPESNNAGYVMQNIANGFIPFSAALRFGARQLDPEMKQAQDFADKVKSGIPTLSESVPSRHSWITGKPIESSYFYSEMKDDDTLEELLKYSGQIREVRPQKELNGVKLSAEQYSQLCKLQGTIKLNGATLYEALENTFKGRRYQNTDGETKDYKGNTARSYVISDILERYQRAATQSLLKTDMSLNQEINTLQRNKRAQPKGGTGKVNLSNL